MKVSQLGNDAASFTAYHHGEESLSKAIIKMAQEYVGSNNVALLIPGKCPIYINSVFNRALTHSHSHVHASTTCVSQVANLGVGR